jgi:hypothetical protein
VRNKEVVNIAASFRARLLDLSRQRREDFQFVLGRWMIERFLYPACAEVRADTLSRKYTLGDAVSYIRAYAVTNEGLIADLTALAKTEQEGVRNLSL